MRKSRARALNRFQLDGIFIVFNEPGGEFAFIFFAAVHALVCTYYTGLIIPFHVIVIPTPPPPPYYDDSTNFAVVPRAHDDGNNNNTLRYSIIVSLYLCWDGPG